MIKNMAKGHFIGVMVDGIQVLGKMENRQELEFIMSKRMILKQVNGLMEREQDGLNKKKLIIQNRKVF